MNVTVIGTGFVGVVTSAVLAKLGNRVIGLDVDPAKIDFLSQAKPPFYEPELAELLNEGINQTHNLRFTTSYKEAIEAAEVILIAVGTPSAPDGTADLKYVFEASKSLAPYLKAGAIVAIKSTVPPGTTKKVAKLIEPLTTNKFYVASLPEFLREGSAVSDTMHPDRVVIGATEPEVIRILRELHKPLGGQIIIVAPESAQMAKYTANAYLAMRITFINQIANLCELNGAKISEVIRAIGPDKRIGTHYWYPGMGYGARVFPKDVKELAAYAKSMGEGTGLLPKIDELNDERPMKLLKRFEQKVGGFRHKKVAVLGLSFKPNTNDMREAPSLTVVPYLIKAGAQVVGYDPQAMPEAAKIIRNLELAETAEEAIKEAEVIMLLVEWPELVKLDLVTVAKLAKKEAWLIDTRNQFNRDAVIKAGLKYIAIGNS